MLKHEISYYHDSAALFERIANQAWAMFLDSGQMLDAVTGQPASQYGRYDIIVAEPFITLVTCGETTTITQNGMSEISLEDPFFLLKNILNQYKTLKTELPFAGGAMGYFAYDLARRLEKLPNNARPAVAIPEMMIGIYDWALVVDHREMKSTLISHGLDKETHSKWFGLQALFDQPCEASVLEEKLTMFEVKAPVTSNLTELQYKQAFNKIKAYIEAGDCYQVNLAQRFSTKVEGDSWLMYQKLRKISPAPFMAYLQLPLNSAENFQVLSNSPERFLQTKDYYVETRPIKGTRPRSDDSVQDTAYSKELLTSAKDKAENLMIVDLLRNDLSKSCDSVKVNQLFQLQSFANVHHLVSIIVGKLKAGKTAVDVLRDCFPGGSITGAPKLRAMQIIDELEPHRRGLYCGAIGYIGFDGNMDTNIAIRTAIVCKKILNFYAGGGIVADSDGSKEYTETLDKASSFTTITKFFTRL
jgi:para-aminobenzoate synthetase component 1